MATTVMVVLLMDTLSDLSDNFNKISQLKSPVPLTKFTKTETHEDSCNSRLTDSIIKTVKKEFNINVFRNDIKQHSIFDDFNDVFGSVEKESITTSLEANLSFEKNTIKDYSKTSDDIECQKGLESLESVSYEASAAEFPVRAPFLVVIFESLMNITAETCAGTLLSPHWVITAASCVNNLEYLRKNGSNITERSRYTIIAETTNPFVDGTAHNVTKVVMHPDHLGVSPTLAMMRIEPGVAAEGLDIVKHKLPTNVKAMVYGWQSVKNESASGFSTKASVPVTVSTSDKCVTNSTRCATFVTSKDEDLGKIAQLSPGGPVVVMLGGRSHAAYIAQLGTTGLVPTPLAAHARWINSMLRYSSAEHARQFGYS